MAYLASCAEGERRNHTPRSSRRRGASLVEFAVVAPVFFFVIFGIFEFARALMVVECLTEAAREGARVAIIEGATSTQIQNAVTNFLNGVLVSGDTAQILVNDAPVTNASSAVAYDEMTVTVTVPASAVSWVPNGLLGNTTLTGTYTYRRE